MLRFVPLALVAVVACVTPDEEPATDPDEVEAARTSSAVEVLRLGDGRLGAEDAFGDVRDVALGPAGTVAVVDRLAHEVRIFTSAGDYVRTLGREGDGPGDLREPRYAIFEDDGGLVVASLGQRWLTRFPTPESSGEFELLELRSEWNAAERPVLSDSGSVIIRASPPGNTSPGWGRAVLTFGRAEGELRSTAYIPDYPAQDSLQVTGRYEIPRDGRSPMVVTGLQPFAPRVVQAFGHDTRYAYALTSRYHVEVFDHSGQELFHASQRLTPVEPTSQELERAESELESARARVLEMGGDFEMPAFPQYKPPLYDVWFDQLGRLWVQVSVDGDELLATADVYNRLGGLVFRARWPRAVDLSYGAAFQHTVAGVQADSLGVESVVVFEFR